MKGHFSLLLAALLALTLSATVLAGEDRPAPGLVQTHSDEAACENAVGPNLLQKPSFEGEYSAYVPPGGHPDCPTGVCNSVQMADGWTPWWLSPTDTDDQDIRNPEYKPATKDVPGPDRVHDGDRAQQYFTFQSTHEAGIYQQVSVTPGGTYCFSIWGHSWSSSNDDPETSDSELEQKLGIDPLGGSDWQSPDIIWGGPVQQYNEYGLLSITAEAEAAQITAYTWSKPIWPVKHNDVYWDQASLRRVRVMSVPTEEITFLAEAGVPTTSSKSLDITFDGDPSLTWSATITPGGTLSPVLSPMGGNADDDLTISVDSTGLSLGTYNADVVVTSDPSADGSPATIPVTLHVVADLQKTYLPTARQPH